MWNRVRFFAVTIFAAALAATSANAEDVAEIEAFVQRAQQTVADFGADPDMQRFRTLLPEAKGILVVPQSVRGGFIFGASGGHGALLAHDQATNDWSYPAFHVMGSVTFGLQVGAEVSEIVMLIMSDRGMDSLLSGTVKLGGDVSVAAGPVGTGAKAQTADVIAWARSKGAYAGVSIEGAVIETKDTWNDAFYSKGGLRPVEIIVERKVSNPRADGLRAEVAKIAKGQ